MLRLLRVLDLEIVGPFYIGQGLKKIVSVHGLQLSVHGLKKLFLWLFRGKCIRVIREGVSSPGSNENEGCIIGDPVVITIFQLFNILV